MKHLSLLVCGAVFALASLGWAKPPAAVKPDPTRAYLEIKCNVNDAEIVVDNKPVGKTPLLDPLSLDAGKHSVKVRKKGYSEYADVVMAVLGHNATVKIELLAVAGYLSVSTEDKDKAQVYLDGKFLGDTPYENEVPIGPHELEVRRLGFYDFRKQFSSVGGEEYPFSAPLQKLPPELDPLVKKPPLATLGFLARPAGQATASAGGVVVITSGILLGMLVHTHNQGCDFPTCQGQEITTPKR